MAFKFVFVTLMVTALIATSHAGVIGAVTYANEPVVTKIANPAVDAVASTHQNVVRSFGGTVSQYSKAIDTPYSSVRKEDTRISNNVYTPAIAKTVTYAAPVKTFNYAAAAPAHTATAVYTHSAQLASKPLVYAAPNAELYREHHQEPATVYHEQPHYEATAYAHAEPIATKTVEYAAPVVNTEPAHFYHSYQHAPAVSTATTTYNHGPDGSTYSHNAPGIAAYGSSQSVRYSPADMVSHMSFDGFGTHWGF